MPSGELLATLIRTDTDAWCVFTPDGYLDGSLPGRWLVLYARGDDRYPWHLGWPRHGVPGLLSRVLQGDRDYALPRLRRVIGQARR